MSQVTELNLADNRVMVQSERTKCTEWPYRLGCPVWACKHWAGRVYPEGTSTKRYLDWYSKMFNTVEGNSTFYALPPIEQFKRWVEESASSFQFCFKFPQVISHERQLQNCERELDQFFERLNILANKEKLGPTFLQLGPSFSGRQLDQLTKFVEQLPRQWPWAVELRHQDWFDSGTIESQLDQLLREHKIDRVLFDSSPLFSSPPTDESERQAQSRKPKSPFRTSVTGKRPMLRFIGRNQACQVQAFVQNWAVRIAQWIVSGLTPYVFTHAPDDTFAPDLAVQLHAEVIQQLAILQPERSPVSKIIQPRDEPQPVQQMLF
ncbi:MAG: DUF72 domain-containing protein [Pirellulales bacterium]